VKAGSVLVPSSPAVSVCIVVLFCSVLVSRSPAQSARDLRQGNADYPVPFPVALQSLQDGLPSLLSPSTVRSLSFSFAASSSPRPLPDARQQRFPLSPQSPMDRHVQTSAGIEVAPFLIGAGTDLADYLSGRMMRVLLRTRVSAAFVLTPGSGFTGAAALRWMLHDDADLRSDSIFQRTLSAWGTDPSLRLDPAVQERIDSLRDALKDSLWNRSVFELAASGVFSSPGGSSSHNASGVVSAHGASGAAMHRYHGYFVGALPLHGSSAQILIGASGWLGTADGMPEYRRRGALVVRACAGGVSERIYIESGVTGAKGYRPDVSLGLGSMLRIGRGIWLSGGIRASLNDRAWAGQQGFFNVSFGTPELIR